MRFAIGRSRKFLAIFSLLLIGIAAVNLWLTFIKATCNLDQVRKVNSIHFPYLKPKNVKLILLWTKGWSSRTHPVAGWDLDNNTLQNCQFKCDFTDDKNLLDQSDAIVYHGVNWFAWNIFGLPALPKRRPNYDQIWTFLRIESPANQPHSFAYFDNQFNWTVTYRADSDIQYAYGGFENLTSANSSEIIRSKWDASNITRKKLVGWMVSNCAPQSQRQLLVDKLQKYIPVDIYGGCSPSGARLDCPGSNDCYAILAKKYKFWLAFEKSLCQDYLTEKFFLPLFYGMVPILYAHKSVRRFIPKGSYIDVNDFSSLEDLAIYLIYLDTNVEEYEKYFEWKKYLRVSLGNNFWCSFCEKLHGVGRNSTRHFYKSIDKWFYYNHTDTYQCVDPSGPLFQ